MSANQLNKIITILGTWQAVLSMITTCFANFSNQYTLSKLFGTDLTSENTLAQRKEHTIQMMLAYLRGRNEGG